MECPQCHGENLDGATVCYACQTDFTRATGVGRDAGLPFAGLNDSQVAVGSLGDPAPRDGRGRKAGWIVGGVALAAVAIIAAFVLASGSSPGGSAGVTSTPSGPLSVTQQAMLLDSGGRGLDQAAQEYQSVLIAADDAATQNAAAVKQWSAEWKQRQVAYQSEVAATQAYNASHPGTPRHKIPGRTYDADPSSTGIDIKTDSPKWVAATPAQHKALPSHPSQPAKIDAPDEALLTRLDSVAKALTSLERRLGDAGIDASLSQTATDAKLGVALLQKQVRTAGAAVRLMVRHDKAKGDIVVRARLAPLSLAGIGDAVQAVRVDLRGAAAALSLPDKVIAWASR